LLKYSGSNMVILEDNKKTVPTVLVTEQVEAVEPVGAWGTVVNPKELTFAQLKFHIKARGREPFGLRADLERELNRLLKGEQDAARREYFAKRQESRAEFRELLDSLREGNPEFKLQDVHTWLHEERRSWDWDDDDRSLAHRQRLLRRKYPTELVRRSRNPFPEEPSERKRRAQEKYEQNERIKEEKLAQLNKERTCTWELMRADGNTSSSHTVVGEKRRVRALYCTNRRQTLSRGRNATHDPDAKFCAFHTKFCNGEDHYVPPEADAKAESTAVVAAKSKPAKRPPVRKPNELGLCTECFFKIRMRRPVAMEPHSVPGALERKERGDSETQANTKNKHARRTRGENKSGTQTNDPTSAVDDMRKYQTASRGGVAPNLAMKEFWCQWKAKDPNGNVFACCNIRIRHPLVSKTAIWKCTCEDDLMK
jgi:hypothetical protein